MATTESNGSTFLEGDSLSLRTVERDDIEFVRDHSNDASIRRAMATTGPTTSADLERRFEDDDAYQFTMCDERTCVGYISLHDLNFVDGSATLSYWVSPDHWGNEYATEAVSLLVGYAFDQLRLHKVRADVRDFSDASKRVLEKVGFTREGVLRESRFVDGEHYDRHRYGILRREWESDAATDG